MLTYQVKITIEALIETEWLTWMKTRHVPDVIATGLVRSFQVLKPEDEAHTYYFNYQFEDKNAFQEYEKTFADELRKDVLGKYPDCFKAERQFLHWI